MRRTAVRAVMAGIVGVVISVLMMPSGAGANAAPRWYCSTTTTYGEPCIPDTTAYSSTSDPTTTMATTTTVAKETTTTGNVGICCLQAGTTTTTTASTTSTTATTSPTTTAATTTAPAQARAVEVPEETTVVPAPTLPVTGSEGVRTALLVGFGLALLGFSLAALSDRKRR